MDLKTLVAGLGMLGFGLYFLVQFTRLAFHVLKSHSPAHGEETAQLTRGSIGLLVFAAVGCHVGLLLVALAGNKLHIAHPPWMEWQLVVVNVAVVPMYVSFVLAGRRLDAVPPTQAPKFTWRDVRDILLFCGGIVLAAATMI